VVERTETGERRTTQAADTHRGSPQGSPISPLFSNLYFRRFVLAWKQFGIEQRLRAHVVNYADDLVICCPPGNGPAAMTAFRNLMIRLGLTVNERKTRLAKLPEEHVDFLGYTIGQFYGRDGKAYLGTRPCAPGAEANPRGNVAPRKLAATGCQGRRSQPTPSGLVRILRPRTGRRSLSDRPSVHGTTGPPVVDAAATEAGYGVQAVPGSLSVRNARAVQTAREPHQTAESEGTRF
jgi:hypothetical protein